MAVVIVLAEAIRGSKRWLDLGVIQFQPSELGKVLFVLAIAGFLVERASRVTRWRTLVSALGLAAVPMLLVFLQPDLGTALVYAAALLAVLFFVGVRWRQLLVLLVLGAIAVASVLWFLPSAGVQVLKPYQTARLTLDPGADPSGITYNLNQSITAVGAGGLTQPTSRSRPSRSSAASSVPRSCSSSTCSWSGGACASSRSRVTSTVPPSPAGSSSPSCSRSS
jgi:rod shape determining protein RodA